MRSRCAVRWVRFMFLNHNDLTPHARRALGEEWPLEN